MMRKLLPIPFILAGLTLAGCGDYGEVEQGTVVAVKFEREPSGKKNKAGKDIMKEVKPPVVTIIVDNNDQDRETKRPKANYMVLKDPHEYILPELPGDKLVGEDMNPDRGADPSAGLCVNLDVKGKTITMFNPNTQEFQTFSIEIVEDIDRGLRLNRPQNLLHNEAPVLVDTEGKTVVVGERKIDPKTNKVGDQTIATRKNDKGQDERVPRNFNDFPVIDAEKKTIQVFYRRLYGNQARLVTFKLANDDDFDKYQGKDWRAGDEVRVYCKVPDKWKPEAPGKVTRFMNITKTDITRR